LEFNEINKEKIMKLIEELKNFEPETETNKMQIKIKNEVTAWVLRNKIERQGFPVEITKERNFSQPNTFHR